MLKTGYIGQFHKVTGYDSTKFFEGESIQDVLDQLRHSGYRRSLVDKVYVAKVEQVLELEGQALQEVWPLEEWRS